MIGRSFLVPEQAGYFENKIFERELEFESTNLATEHYIETTVSDVDGTSVSKLWFDENPVSEFTTYNIQRTYFLKLLLELDCEGKKLKTSCVDVPMKMVFKGDYTETPE